ncbi:MAG TPA: TerB family tellurite resistance protein [Thermoanaerobaculia bacterium]|nr:TerB family tellurite resistance protein [Thermoanaerobaculia bacterium]
MGIEALRAFFAPRASKEEGPPKPDPVTVAACALLLEIAHADDVFQSEERDRIARHIREEMHVSEDELQEVFRIAEEERRESVDLFHFTQLLREHLSRDQRLRLVEAIWGVVYSDGSLSEVEGHLARKIAELLGFQHPEVQAVKEKVAASQ